METFGASISEVRNVATGNSNDGTVEMEGFKQRVDEIISKARLVLGDDQGEPIGKEVLSCLLGTVYLD
ncbi:hypothetical protein DEO72_LG5g2721 [Vigna unguiculata]|uniref:Uncharacterized protein n=1 Tax=Vigna unguiculata TaxID=3917 RepID=A0A4D6M372_VIGUN|nr:hypothetical protein DEO72_LG5g2721 [Vigna unguiculata]